MAQIIRQYDPWEALGTGLGTGVQRGVEKQLEYLQELQKRGIEGQALTQLLGGIGGGEAGAQVPGAGGAGGVSFQDILKSPLATPQKVQLAGMLQRDQLAQQKLRQQKELSERKIGARRAEKEYERVLNVVDDYAKTAKSADDEINTLNEYERILNEGESGMPLINAFRQVVAKSVFGKDAETDWVLPVNAQKQVKLSAQFLMKILPSIKGRPSEMIIRSIMKSKPNIWTSPEVQRYIVEALKYDRYLEKAYSRVAQDIVDKNPDLRMVEFRRKIEKQIDKIKPQLEERFLPKQKQFKVGQYMDKIPLPFEVPIGTQIEDDQGYIKENTGTEWKIVGKAK